MLYLKEDNYYIYIKCECGCQKRVSRSMVIQNEIGYKIITPFSCECKHPDNNIYMNKKNIVDDNPDYKPIKYVNDIKIKQKSDKNNITCPRYGSNRIQLVNRKWSLLTVFLRIR